MPLRMPGDDRLSLHPCGKAFIEPDIVPPGGGYEIAKPLVRDLMRDNRGVGAPAEDRGGLFIHEQSGVTIEDGGSIFHAAPFVVRNGYHIQLAEWILDAVPLVIKLDGLRRCFQG